MEITDLTEEVRLTDEARRTAAMQALDILDAEYEERFDRITRLAQRLFGTEIAAVTLLDGQRQWFVSHIGDLDDEVPRENSFCSYAIQRPDETMVVGNASEDDRFADNPLVTGKPGIRFYAGHPIKAPGGKPIGALCVIDSDPRAADTVDEQSLRDLAAMIDSEIASLSLAITDQLTGLSNRRGFEMLAPRLFSVAERSHLPVAAIYVDVDNLKPLNDFCGHDAGDRALIETAALLQRELRESDVVARVGGDEFVAFLTDSSGEQAERAAKRIAAALEERNAFTDESFELQLSVGTASARPGQPGVTLDRLVEAADSAMIAAKHAGKLAAGAA